MALKAVLFFSLLYLAPNSWLLGLVFLLAAFYFYFRPLFNSNQLVFSFLILLSICIWVLQNEYLTESPWFTFLAVILGILFGLIIGIKNLIFLKREPVYYLLNGFLFLLVFTMFFASEKTELFFVKYLLTGLAIFFLSREFLSFNSSESVESFGLRVSSRRNLTVLVFSFLMLQALWVAAVLPLGFLNAASFSLLIILILENFLVEHWSGTMNRRIILRNITLFLVLGLIIFGASQWSP